jgi:hypothetical protein
VDIHNNEDVKVMRWNKLEWLVRVLGLVIAFKALVWMWEFLIKLLKEE